MEEIAPARGTVVEDKLQQGVCRTAGEAPTAEIFIKRGKNCTNQSGKMPNNGSRPKKAKNSITSYIPEQNNVLAS